MCKTQIIITTYLTHLSLAFDKGTLANSVDTDQTPQNAASDRGLHCLHFIKKFLQNRIIIRKNNQTSLIQEKGRKETEKTVEEMKERNREERGTGMKVKKQEK